MEYVYSNENTFWPLGSTFFIKGIIIPTKGEGSEHQLVSLKISSVTKFKLSMLQLINPVPICQSPSDTAPHFIPKLFPSLRTHLASKLRSFYRNLTLSSELTSLPKWHQSVCHDAFDQLNNEMWGIVRNLIPLIYRSVLVTNKCTPVRQRAELKGQWLWELKTFNVFFEDVSFCSFLKASTSGWTFNKNGCYKHKIWLI